MAARSRLLFLPFLFVFLLIAVRPAIAAERTLTLNQSEGEANDSFQATYQIFDKTYCTGGTPSPQAQFAIFQWEESANQRQMIGKVLLEPVGTRLIYCRAILDPALPPDRAKPGQHQIFAFVEGFEQDTSAAAPYTLIAPSPSAKPSPSPSPSPSPTAASPSPSPTLASPSQSASPPKAFAFGPNLTCPEIARRNIRWWVYAAAAGVLLLAGGGIYTFLRRGRVAMMLVASLALVTTVASGVHPPAADAADDLIGMVFISGVVNPAGTQNLHRLTTAVAAKAPAPTFDKVTLSVSDGPETEQLSQFASSGEQLQTVEIVLCHSDKPYFYYGLEGVNVDAFKDQGDTDLVALSFQRIHWKYVLVGETGQLLPGSEAGWDLTTNTKI